MTNWKEETRIEAGGILKIYRAGDRQTGQELLKISAEYRLPQYLTLLIANLFDLAHNDPTIRAMILADIERL